jgi:uncharacterized membrane protein YeaQ/YmgE (transglycosylase-associated protein family)
MPAIAAQVAKATAFIVKTMFQIAHPRATNSFKLPMPRIFLNVSNSAQLSPVIGDTLCAATQSRAKTYAGGHATGWERENMSAESLLIILLVGLIAGWLAGQIAQGTGFGIVGDLVIGIVGAFLGSWLFAQLGIHLGAGIVGAIISATIGAVILLLIIRVVRGGSGWRGRWAARRSSWRL